MAYGPVPSSPGRGPASPGDDPRNPRWPTARFLRHRAGALLARGTTPGTPDGLRPGSFVTGPGPWAPGGMIRWVWAISPAGTPEYSFASATTWNTVRVTRAAAAIPAAHGRSSVRQRRSPAAASADSSRDTGSAMTSPANGARNPA